MRTSDTSLIDAPPPTLTTGAVHDLRNVLFLIGAHSERLLNNSSPDDPRLHDLRAIREAATRGATLARQIVSSAREMNRPCPVDVNAAVRGMETLLRSLAGDQVQVDLRLARTCWPVTANAVQIEQVLMNLVVNARDAMPSGGRIVITTENRTATGAGPRASAHFVVLSVADTGVGIDPQVAAHIFDPFFTTRASSGGTGVGLSTVRAIALLNGGHVELSTTPGEGTTVRVVLPRGEDAVPEPSPEPQPSICAGPARVLLVENEDAIREFVRRSLKAAGYDVVPVPGAGEALRAFGAEDPPVDAIVTDVNLPDGTGPALVSAIRASAPEIAVVFISGSPEWIARLNEAGERAIAKPFTSSELVAGLQAALGGRAADGGSTFRAR